MARSLDVNATDFHDLLLLGISFLIRSLLQVLLEQGFITVGVKSFVRFPRSFQWLSSLSIHILCLVFVLV